MRKYGCNQGGSVQVKKRQHRGLRRSESRGFLSACLALAGVALMAVNFAPPAHAQAVAQSRIVAPIRADKTQVLRGTVHPLVAVAQNQGRMSGSTVIHGISLIFKRSAAQEADLKNLLRQQQTKGSPMYHQWLRPGQFAARYGMSAQDLAKVAAWLQTQGFKIDSIPPSADRIDFTGTAAQVESTFHTQLNRYQWHGQAEWANATDISVPEAISGVVLNVAHLNTFRPQPHLVRRPVHVTLNPHYTLQEQNGTEVNFLAPSDVHTIYDIDGLYNAGITGSGQTIGIMGQTDIMQYQSDIQNFRSLSGLNASNLPTQVVVPTTGSAAVSPSDLEEADIDVEWSGAVAKDASILYVTVGNNQNYGVFDSLQYAVQTPLISGSKFIPVLSISYGNCEQNFTSADIQALEGYLQQANSQGQTVVGAAGDAGSADCDATGQNSSGTYVGATGGLAVDYPASSVYVTSAGGTSFSGDVNNQSQYWNQQNNSNNGSAIGYIPETTWNDTVTLKELQSIGSLSAGGGGKSTLFTKPSWQVGNGVPNDGQRDVPDVSLDADPNHDGYVLCTEETSGSGSSTTLTGTSSCVYPVGSGEVPYFDANGSGYLFGGTSIAAPQYAAILTLLNQSRGNTSGIGNANPILYLEAQNTSGAFHDVTTGSNAVVCQQGSPNCVSDPNNPGNYIMSCCNAGSGYDLATGLGSVDVAALAAVWPGISSASSEFSLVPNPGSVTVKAGGSATTSLVLSPSNGFSGTVSLTCSNLPSGVTCSFSPGASVDLTSGTAQTVTLTIAASSSASATAALRRLPLDPRWPSWPAETVLAGVFGFSLLGMRRRGKMFAHRWMAALLLTVSLLAAAGITACASGGSPVNTGGGGGGGTKPSASVTVTGSSGTTSASAVIQLTIS